MSKLSLFVCLALGAPCLATRFVFQDITPTGAPELDGSAAVIPVFAALALLLAGSRPSCFPA